MKQSIIEVLKVGVDERGAKGKMMDAKETALKLEKEIRIYIAYRDSIGFETHRKERVAIRVALINSMKQVQAMLWELQLILGIEDLEKLTEDYIEWRELQSIPH